MTDLVTPQARAPSTDTPPPAFSGPYGFYAENDSISLIECARLLYGARGLIAAIVAAFGLVALAFAYLSTPIYRAEVLLAPAVHEKPEGPSALFGQLGDIAAMVGGGQIGLSRDRTAESIATLRSRSLATDFIRAQELKPLLFPNRWDPVESKWRPTEKVPTDLDAYDVFDKQVRSVNVDRRSGLVSLAIEWRDPALAATWANRLVTEVNTRRRVEAIREAESSIKYLQQQLARTSSIEIQQSIYRLIEAHTKTIALANAREDYAFRIIDPAVTPERRIRPKRLLILAAGLVLGLFTAIGVVFVRRAVERERAVAPT